MVLTGCLLFLLQVQVNLVFLRASRPRNHHEGKNAYGKQTFGVVEFRKWGLDRGRVWGL